MAIIERLVQGRIGIGAARRLLATILVEDIIVAERDGQVTRAGFATALGICLFDALLDSVPTGAAYVADRVAAGEQVYFDHGAIRTVRFPGRATGALPAGHDAFHRILVPLGYAIADTYPLPRLKMTGRAYCHRDYPEAIPQYFVSELHVDQFDERFAATAERVFGTSRDPLGSAALGMLDMFATGSDVPFALAEAALPEILAAFARQHEVPALADYEALLAQSPEAAWIASEGNTFNHATDRVADVAALADRERALGRPIKDCIEVSSSGRVRQTAYRADPVSRTFRTLDGDVARDVPGSFYEFITRDVDPATGRLDLAFDSGNATGIFGMTRAA